MAKLPILVTGDGESRDSPRFHQSRLTLAVVSLKQRTEQAADVLAELLAVGAGIPLSKLQLAAAGKVMLLFGDQFLGEAGIVDQNANFGVEDEGADIHVAGADQANFLVDAEVFGVQEFTLEEMDFHPVFKQFSVVRLLSLANEELVFDFGDNKVYIDTSHRSRLHSLLQRLVGNEIGCGDDNSLAGVVNQEDDDSLGALT